MKDPRKSALMCCEGASHPDLALVEPELVGKVDGGWIPALAPLSQISGQAAQRLHVKKNRRQESRHVLVSVYVIRGNRIGVQRTLITS